MQKRSLTLLELMLALTILAIVVGTLFFQLKELTLLSVRTEKRLATTFRAASLHERLLNLFSHLKFCSYSSGRFEFSTTPQTDPDPSFCKGLEGALFVENNQLVLELKPLDSLKKDTVRREVLLSSVTSLQIECIDLSEGKYKSFSEWNKEALPSSMIMIVDELRLPFFTEVTPGEIHL